MFFDVVTKVSIFYESVIRVDHELPKITLHLLFFVSNDSQLCCVEGEEERGWNMSIDHKTKKNDDKR